MLTWYQDRKGKNHYATHDNTPRESMVLPDVDNPYNNKFRKKN